MKLLNKITAAAATLLLGVATFAVAFGGTASADCYQYNQNGFTTSDTPVFNNICGVPEGIGNESDFVRVRQSTNGNDEDNNNNPAYTGGTLTAACNDGDKFDVWNYLHNDASTAYNPDTNPNDPSAVAHDVEESLTATFGTNTQFTFGDTITASNAASVHDTAVLDCGSNQVQLSLVPGSVHIYSIPYGAWENLADGTVNGGPFKVGSTNTGGEGSGDQWGCWNYRIVIVYQVTTKTIPKQTQTPPVCTELLTPEWKDQTATIEGLKYGAGTATVSGATIDFYNGSTLVNTAKLTLAQLQNLQKSPVTYTFADTGNYTIKATINTTYNGKADNVTSDKCEATHTVNSTTPPPTNTTTPPPTTTTTPPPTTLVNTGAGSVIGIFAAASALGAGAYRWFLSRRLQRD